MQKIALVPQGEHAPKDNSNATWMQRDTSMQVVRFEGQGERNMCKRGKDVVSQASSEGQYRMTYHMFADPRLEDHRIQEPPPRTASGEELLDYWKRWAMQKPAMSNNRSEQRVEAELFPNQPMTGDLPEKEHALKTEGMIVSESMEEQRRAAGDNASIKGKPAVWDTSDELRESLSRGGRSQSERTWCVPPPHPPGFGVGLKFGPKCTHAM